MDRLFFTVLLILTIVSTITIVNNTKGFKKGLKQHVLRNVK